MTLAHVVPLAVQGSVALIVFAVGLDARWQDVTHLAHRPGLLLRSLLAMNVLMPLLAVVVAVSFELNPVVEVALIALSLTPVPPLLPTRQIQAGGAQSYTIGLLVTAAVFSVVFVPLALAMLGRIFGRPVHVEVGTVLRIVATSILAPLLAGIAVHAVAPAGAARIARPIRITATALLLVAAVPILVVEWRSVVALVGNFSIVAIVLFTMAGLAIGHILGGPDPGERTVLALSTSSRHPAMALAIAANVDKQALLAAVLLAVIVGALIALPYVKRQGRRHAQGAAAQRTRASQAKQDHEVPVPSADPSPGDRR
jgi:BASS family bile acid:Na+ symporter